MIVNKKRIACNTNFSFKESWLYRFETHYLRDALVFRQRMHVKFACKFSAVK